MKGKRVNFVFIPYIQSTIGFPNGYRLSPRPAILLGEDENLKQVRYLEIRKNEDLYSETTLKILQEAILLDETLGQQKSYRRRYSRKTS